LLDRAQHLLLRFLLHGLGLTLIRGGTQTLGKVLANLLNGDEGIDERIDGLLRQHRARGGGLAKAWGVGAGRLGMRVAGEGQQSDKCQGQGRHTHHVLLDRA
jgi:hypothetical protein